MENSSTVYLQSCHVLPQRETNSSHVGTASGTPDNFPPVMRSEHFGFSLHVSRSRCRRGRDYLKCLIILRYEEVFACMCTRVRKRRENEVTGAPNSQSQSRMNEPVFYLEDQAIHAGRKICLRSC